MESKIKKRIAFSLLLLAFSFVVACKKFVEIPPPVNRLVTTTVFNNDASATAAQTVIYTQMQQAPESFFLSQNNGLLADELTNYSTDTRLIQYYTNAMDATTTNGPWTNAYNYIYQANAIIEGLQNNNGVSTAVKKQLTGESKFIRAFWHFYLTNCYGDVPLVTSTDYTKNAVIARTPKAQVYLQIISDLTDAQNLLSINYVDASDTAVTIERVRPTKWSATALLARVYLYLGDLTHDQTNYMNAEKQATIVINNTGMFSLVQDLNQVFLANSTEAIWQLQTPQPINNGATPDGQNFILIAAPGINFATNSISRQLMNAFEARDNRKTSWIGSFTPDAITYYYFPYKYKEYISTSADEYTMVLRLAEQYLIRAEARAQLGESNAVSDLNAIRNRAGLLNYAGSTDKPSLITAILHERQVELFTEWGCRWFDLIRTGNANSVMGVITQQKGGTWNSNGQLYPIPQAEQSKDHNLTQNVGY